MQLEYNKSNHMAIILYTKPAQKTIITTLAD